MQRHVAQASARREMLATGGHCRQKFTWQSCGDVAMCTATHLSVWKPSMKLSTMAGGLPAGDITYDWSAPTCCGSYHPPAVRQRSRGA